MLSAVAADRMMEFNCNARKEKLTEGNRDTGEEWTGKGREIKAREEAVQG